MAEIEIEYTLGSGSCSRDDDSDTASDQLAGILNERDSSGGESDNSDSPTADSSAVACTSAETRSTIRQAVADRLVLLGLPQEELLQNVDQLEDATSPISGAITRQIEMSAGVPIEVLGVCEVDMGFEQPMFISVFIGNPETGQVGGAVMNYGIPGDVAPFGENWE